MLTINTTPAAVFRSITEENPPTLLVDEADTIFGTPKVAEKNEEMRGLLNAGHQRNRYVTRVVGNDHTPHRFATFAMAALAGIGDLPDTIMDRAVVIRMRRRAEGERVKPFRSRRDIPALHDLRDRIAAWARPLLEEAADLEPDMPVEDRAADTWEPLVIIAGLAAGPWPRLARTACARMVAAEIEAEEDQPGGARILADIRRVFAAQREPDNLTTDELLHQLRQDAESPWAEWGRNGLNAKDLAAMLREFGIKPGNVRIPDGTQRKGYMRNKFLDAWRRYCPNDPPRGQRANRPHGGLSPAPPDVPSRRPCRDPAAQKAWRQDGNRGQDGNAITERPSRAVLCRPGRPRRITAGGRTAGRDGCTPQRRPAQQRAALPAQCGRFRAADPNRRVPLERKNEAAAVPALTCACNAKTAKTDHPSAPEEYPA
jgi:hypothetical protein